MSAAVALADALPGKRDAVHERFNSQARELGADNRMLLTKCGDLTCNYGVSGNLAAIASSRQETPDKLDSVILIFAKNSDGTSMILSMGILMLIYSPETDQADRTAALTQLTGGITSHEDKASVILGETKYTITKLGTVGIWFTIASR